MSIMSRTSALRGLATGLDLALRSIQQLLEAPDPDEWVDQTTSPLGRRAHCAAVRRGDLRAHKVKGKVLVRRQDLDAYIEKHGVKVARKPVSLTEEEEIAQVLSFRAPARRR